MSGLKSKPIKVYVRISELTTLLVFKSQPFSFIATCLKSDKIHTIVKSTTKSSVDLLIFVFDFIK